MKFEIGDTVRNNITKKVYTVVDVEEQPYIKLVPIGQAEDATKDSEDAISMHEDFLELVEEN